MRLEHVVAAIIGGTLMHLWIWLADDKPATWQAALFLEVLAGVGAAFLWEYRATLAALLKRALPGQGRH